MGTNPTKSGNQHNSTTGKGAHLNSLGRELDHDEPS